MALQGLAAEGEGGPGNGEHAVHVLQELLRGPGEHRAVGELLEAPLARQLRQAPHDVHVRRCPVLVHEEHGLCAALLAREAVGVVVRLPGHVLHVCHVGAQDLPVEACVLQLYLALEIHRQFVRHLLRAREESHPGIPAQQNLIEHRAVAVDEVHIGFGHATGMQHPQELLHDNGHLYVHLRGALVAHKYGRERLQAANLQGEVEGGDDTDAAERHPIAHGALAQVVPRKPGGLRQHPHVVAAVVLQPGPHSLDLAPRLAVALGGYSLNQSAEEVRDLRLEHLSCCCAANLSKHHIPVRVLEGIVQPGAGHMCHALYKGLDLVQPRPRHLHKHLPVQRIHHVLGLLG
mmetsp:Transcript_87318/g.208881  ORF Transcript_87318/g.208881 Transcript_87318/m.208881 type:complete len:347 (-) Transcript_87318:208-1248(-)